MKDLIDSLASLNSAQIAAVAAVVASLAAILAMPFTIRAANAARDQTAIQREVAHQAAQPYVWATVEGSKTSGASLHLVVGNSGPTVATDVQIAIEPHFPSAASHQEVSENIQSRLSERGIKSIAPNSILRWPLGPGKDILNRDDLAETHTVTVNATGPFGPIPSIRYEFDLVDIKQTLDDPPGSLHRVRKALDKIGGHLESGHGPIRVEIVPRELDEPL